MSVLSSDTKASPHTHTGRVRAAWCAARAQRRPLDIHADDDCNERHRKAVCADARRRRLARSLRVLAQKYFWCCLFVCCVNSYVCIADCSTPSRRLVLRSVLMPTQRNHRYRCISSNWFVKDFNSNSSSNNNTNSSSNSSSNSNSSYNNI